MGFYTFLLSISYCQCMYLSYFYRWQNTRRYMLKEEYKSWWLSKVSKGHVTVWFKKELLYCSLNTGLTSFLNFGSRVRRNSIGNSIGTSVLCHSTQLPRAVSYITVAHEIGHNYGSPVSNLLALKHS